MVDIHIRIAPEILQKYPGTHVGWPDVAKVRDMLAENLEHIGCTIRLRGLLRGVAPEADLGE